jgi:hypothetical protein
MKREIIYIVITGALMVGAFFTGSSIHNGESRNIGNPGSEVSKAPTSEITEVSETPEPEMSGIPTDDIADYYINSYGYITLELCDVQNVNGDPGNPKYIDYLREKGIPDITEDMHDAYFDLSTVTGYDEHDGILTLHTESGDDWIISR